MSIQKQQYGRKLGNDIAAMKQRYLKMTIYLVFRNV